MRYTGWDAQAMHEDTTILAGDIALPGEPPGPSIDHRRLPDELLATARTRLRRMFGFTATVCGAIAALHLVTLFIATERTSVAIGLLLFSGLSTTSGALLLVIRSARVSDERASFIGWVFVCLSSASLSFLLPPFYMSSKGAIPDVTWVSISIAMWPIIIPSGPRATAIGSSIAAMTVPLGLLYTDLFVVDIPAQDFANAMISPSAAAAVAYFGSSLIYRINRQAVQARILGSYRLEERIGAGGMGEVWRAGHARLARSAAIKLIRTEALQSHSESMTHLRARFEREARVTASLRSPHTVELYDYGKTVDGTFYYAMELLDGYDLESLVRRHGPLPPERVLYLARQVCASLEEAHQCGLIHRDIKPGNIFVCRLGTSYDFVKVLDFGLVRMTTERNAPERGANGEVRIAGTPAYLAPEAVQGPASVDHRVDIYSLGCVLYWLLTGQRVFLGDDYRDILEAHVLQSPRPPSTVTKQPVPADLEQLIMDCLDKIPAGRPECSELIARLDSCVDRGRWTEERARAWWQEHSG